MNQPFIIRPRPARDGFDFSGPTLPYGMWYRKAEHASSYARQRGASIDVVIETYDEAGTLVSIERQAPGASRW